MKLRALHRYGYGTRELNPGDEFEADENDGALMVQMGQAEGVGDEPAQESVAQPAKDGKRSRKRGYERRDERAQD